MVTEPPLTDIEITDAMKGVAGRRQGAGSLGEITVGNVGLLQKEVKLLADAANAGGENHIATHIAANLLVHAYRLAAIEIVAGAAHLDHIAFGNTIGEVFQRLFTKETVRRRRLVENHLQKIKFFGGKFTHFGVAPGHFQGVIEVKQVKVAVPHH